MKSTSIMLQTQDGVLVATMSMQSDAELPETVSIDGRVFASDCKWTIASGRIVFVYTERAN